MSFRKSIYAKAGAIALVLAAAGTASVAQARSNVYFSVGANVAPGVSIGVTNGYGPAYYAPVYPAPVYVEPAPVYYPSTYYVPAPVYVRPPVFGVNYYYGPSVYYRHRHHRHWH